MSVEVLFQRHGVDLIPEALVPLRATQERNFIQEVCR